MVSLVLHDQDIVFGSDSLTTRVDRSQRLFQTILRPAQSSLEKVYRNVITLRNIVMHKKFNNYWPATSWIFAPKMTESFDETNSTILQYDSVAQVELWPTNNLTLPNEDMTVPFKDLFYTIEFNINPLSSVFKKQLIQTWILDVLALLGGYLVFCYLLFSLFCQTIPRKLYLAEIMASTYRVKFNKFLKGIKLRKKDTFSSIKNRKLEVVREQVYNDDPKQLSSVEETDSDLESEELDLDQKEALKAQMKADEENMEQEMVEGGEGTLSPKIKTPDGQVTPKGSAKLSAQKNNTKMRESLTAKLTEMVNVKKQKTIEPEKKPSKMGFAGLANLKKAMTKKIDTQRKNKDSKDKDIISPGEKSKAGDDPAKKLPVNDIDFSKKSDLNKSEVKQLPAENDGEQILSERQSRKSEKGKKKTD